MVPLFATIALTYAVDHIVSCSLRSRLVTVRILPPVLDHILPLPLMTSNRSGIEDVIHCQAVDFSDGCGSKFEITIVSPVFSGLKIIAQHRLVHKAIEEERKHIHAITLHTKTPDSWQSEQQET